MMEHINHAMMVSLGICAIAKTDIIQYSFELHEDEEQTTEDDMTDAERARLYHYETIIMKELYNNLLDKIIK